MKIAFVHDDLVQWGGAEKVLGQLSEIFPDAPIFTSVYDENNLFLKNNFGKRKIITSFIQKIPQWQFFYKVFLPLYPLAFESFDFSGYDLVISQTTRFAKSIITKPETTHISYIHTPPRFLWNYSDSAKIWYLKSCLSLLRIYDRVSSKRPDRIIAGSKNAQKRIKKVYQENSLVLRPFVDIGKARNYSKFDGGYFLIISRLNKYKKIDAAVDAFNKNKLPLKIVGSGPELKNLKMKAQDNIQFLEMIDENLLCFLLSGCRGLIVVAEEDFGLTPLEAQSFGKPVVAFAKGGVLETVINGKTGIFFDEQTGESLNMALEKLASLKIESKDCILNAMRFSKENFTKRFLEIVEGIVQKSVI